MKRAIAIVWLLAAACSSRQESAAVAEAPVVVDTLVITARDVPTVHRVSGEVEARDQAIISARVMGYVERVAVAAGAEVEAGATLLVLSAAELDAGHGAARSGLEGASAALAAAEAQLAAARATATLADSTWSRYQILAARKAVTGQELDEVAARRAAAAAALTAAEAMKAVSAAGVESARAGLSQAASLRGYTRVTAPFRGRVLSRHVEPGALVTPGMRLFELGSDGPSRIVAWVDESRGVGLTVGSVARVTIADDALRPAHVVEVEPRVDAASRSFKIELELDDVTATPRPGAYARVELVAGTRPRIMIPRSTVHARGQLDRLFVVADGRASMRIVTLGDVLDDEIEVLSGLRAGEIVIRDPGPELVDGARVSSR